MAVAGRQGVQAREERRAAQQPADQHDHNFNRTARHAHTDSRFAMHRQHQTIARTRARVHADIYRGCDALYEDT